HRDIGIRDIPRFTICWANHSAFPKGKKHSMRYWTKRPWQSSGRNCVSWRIWTVSICQYKGFRLFPVGPDLNQIRVITDPFRLQFFEKTARIPNAVPVFIKDDPNPIIGGFQAQKFKGPWFRGNDFPDQFPLLIGQLYHQGIGHTAPEFDPQIPKVGKASRGTCIDDGIVLTSKEIRDGRRKQTEFITLIGFHLKIKVQFILRTVQPDPEGGHQGVIDRQSDLAGIDFHDRGVGQDAEAIPKLEPAAGAVAEP